MEGEELLGVLFTIVVVVVVVPIVARNWVVILAMVVGLLLLGGGGYALYDSWKLYRRSDEYAQQQRLKRIRRIGKQAKRDVKRASR